MSDFSTNMDEWKVILLGETLLLGVLGRAIQNAPDKEWLQSLINEDIFSESPLESKNQDIETGLSHLQAWSQENREEISDERFIDLQADYTRLFVGTGKAIIPCWESVYFNEDHMLFQEQTLQVRQWYRRFGLESEKLNKEPDDHVGLELSFLAYLAQLGLKALDENNAARFDQVLQGQRQFISEHPLMWVPRWCTLVKDRAGTDFYRGLALLTRGALSSIAEQLQVEIPKEASL
jgi:TorA maturation chaperone TorD